MNFVFKRRGPQSAGGSERSGGGPDPDKVMSSMLVTPPASEIMPVDTRELEAKLAAKYKPVIDFYGSKQNLNKPMSVITGELTDQFTHQGQLDPDFNFVLGKIREKRETPQA